MQLPFLTNPIATGSFNFSADYLLPKLSWVLLVLIVVSFLVFGVRDLARLSWARISAISSVSFAESIRRRVLWITPLAIVGAIVVGQFSNAVDPQDAIRQTTKICLFTAGLVVTLVAIILASTNLPKEIESRVIYTIVTKPTTRLEIVLGKVWGFAKVSAAILLIMGLFTYAYLHVRALQLGSEISQTLQTMNREAAVLNRPTLEYYQRAGLLNAKVMSTPKSMEILSRPPSEGQPRWAQGGQGQKFTVGFKTSDIDYPTIESAIKRGASVALVANMPTIEREPTVLELQTIRMTAIPTKEDAATPKPRLEPEGPALPTTSPTTSPTTAPVTTAPSTAPSTEPTTAPTVVHPLPTFSFLIYGPSHDVLYRTEAVPGGKGTIMKDGVGVQTLPADVLDKLFALPYFMVTIECRSPAIEYQIGEFPLVLQVIEPDGKRGRTFEPTDDSKNPLVVGSPGRYGQQLIGGPEGVGGVSVYHFNNAKPSQAEGDVLTLEMKTGIERAGDSEEVNVEAIPEVQVRVHDPKTGQMSDPVTLRPETNRISYVTFPRSAFPENGNFDVLVRVLTADQWLGVQPQSVALASASRSFPVNLAKSLLILWLMSVLVVAIATFCSTFVSWPIAIVLTLVMLLGHWGVNQIGDAAGPQLGATITTQTQDPVQARLVRETTNFLSNVLKAVSAFLPDISGFQATDDIERGIWIPGSRFADAGWVLLGYGLPMVLLAYLVLKRKEVAP